MESCTGVTHSRNNMAGVSWPVIAVGKYGDQDERIIANSVLSFFKSSFTCFGHLRFHILACDQWQPFL